jgi:hypothetical protein
MSVYEATNTMAFFGSWPTYIIAFFAQMPIGMGQISSAPEQ